MPTRSIYLDVQPNKETIGNILKEIAAKIGPNTVKFIMFTLSPNRPNNSMEDE